MLVPGLNAGPFHCTPPSTPGQVDTPAVVKGTSAFLRVLTGQRCPHRSSTFEFGVRFFPGLRAGLALVGHGVESPDWFAAGQLEGADPTLDAELAARRTDDDQIFKHDRRHRESAFVLVHI